MKIEEDDQILIERKGAQVVVTIKASNRQFQIHTEAGFGNQLSLMEMAAIQQLREVELVF